MPGWKTDSNLLHYSIASNACFKSAIRSSLSSRPQDNARLFFNNKLDEVPTRALSMGVGTICEAKKIILLAFGENKQDAIKGCVEGPMSQFCTASALQAHNDCWIFCDEAAAKKLTLKKYYAWRSATKLGL